MSCCTRLDDDLQALNFDFLFSALPPPLVSSRSSLLSVSFILVEPLLFAVGSVLLGLSVLVLPLLRSLFWRTVEWRFCSLLPHSVRLTLFSLCAVEQFNQLELSEALQSSSSSEAAETGRDHPHPVMDLRPVLQGMKLFWKAGSVHTALIFPLFILCHRPCRMCACSSPCSSLSTPLLACR